MNETKGCKGAKWCDAIPPDVGANRNTGRLRYCSYCGSMHPADVADAIRQGALGEHADRKYGWPHKVYFENVPNPHAGMLEVRASSNTRSEQYHREVREHRYDQHTGKRIEDYVTYTETPKPASATTWGKFYSVHLRDASPEDLATIEQHIGLHIEFDDQGGVRWSSIVRPPSEDVCPGN